MCMSISTMSVDLFTLKIYAWVERALAFVGVLRESSLSLACPFHCGASWLPAFFAGFASGVSLVLCLVSYLLLIRFPLLDFAIPCHQCPLTSSCFADHPTSNQVEWVRA